MQTYALLGRSLAAAAVVVFLIAGAALAGGALSGPAATPGADATATASPSSEASATAALKETDQWRQILAAVDAFLDACTDPAVQRIMMTDAPSVLGWDEWREIDTQYGLGLIKASLEQAMETGLIARQPIDPLAHLLVGALDEAAMYISRAPDTDAARREMGDSIVRMLDGLRL